MNKLTANHFSFKCPMTWDAMAPSANGRFCENCRREVFDLTNCSIDEVIALQRKHGSICGSIRVAQVAVAAISLSAAACQDTTGPQMLGRLVPLKSDGAAIDGIPASFQPSGYNPASLRSGDQTIDRNTIDGVICSPEILEKLRDK